MKMMIIFLVLLPMLALLAMISRKHFSKYKGERWPASQIAGRLQKLEVLHGGQLEDATRQYMKQSYRRFLILLAVLWFAALGILFLPSADRAVGRIERPRAGEEAGEVSVSLTDGTESEEFILRVEAREMTDEEYAGALEEAKLWLSEEMPGENRDLQHVTGNLSFPEQDPSGRLELTWDTGDLSLIGRTGVVRREELEEAAEVTVSCTFSDGIRESVVRERVTLLPFHATETAVERVKGMLKELEEKGRSEDILLLPEQLEQVKISENRTSAKEMICKLYLLSVLLAAVFFVRQFSQEKELLKKRDEELNRVFYRFVKRLTLLLSAGDTLQGALQRAAAVEETYLLPEIQYAINRIHTGSTEAGAYAELGRNIGLRNYIRLFSTISTAGPRGSGQLINLLNTEVRTAENEAREAAKKHGEAAREKLLLPMLLLMVTVIGIVLYPAIAGM